MGWIHYQRGEYDESIRFLALAMKQRRRVPIYHYHLGAALLKNGRTKEARNQLQIALNLSEDFPGAKDAEKLLASIPPDKDEDDSP